MLMLPFLVCNLRNLMRSKIFNLNEFVDNFNVNAFLNNNYTFTLECTDTTVLNKDHNHNMTLSLKSINQKNYTNFFSEDSKYHKNIITGYLKTNESILSE